MPIGLHSGNRLQYGSVFSVWPVMEDVMEVTSMGVFQCVGDRCFPDPVRFKALLVSFHRLTGLVFWYETAWGGGERGSDGMLKRELYIQTARSSEANVFSSGIPIPQAFAPRISSFTTVASLSTSLNGIQSFREQLLEPIGLRLPNVLLLFKDDDGRNMMLSSGRLDAALDERKSLLAFRKPPRVGRLAAMIDTLASMLSQRPFELLTSVILREWCFGWRYVLG